jgi:hypothetical protein
MAKERSPTQYLGVQAIRPPETIRAQRAPTTADLAFQFNTIWIDVPTNDVYCYTNSASGVANWTLLGASSSPVNDVVNGGTGRATLTDHAILVGSGTDPIDFVGPGAVGTILQGAGPSADPAFSTATYPSVATSAGSFLRADGTNWLLSTATIPDSAVQGDLLFASADATWSRLAKSSTPGQILTNNGMLNGPAWAPADGGTATGWSNLGIALAGGVMSVVSESGTVISSTNPALIKIQSKATPGTVKSIALSTAPVGLTESDLTTATFGTTASIAWANVMPFFIYAVLNASGAGTENAISFFCSRNPCAVITPSTVYKASTVASVTSQQAFFGFDDTITSADYASSPCVRVGSFRMVKSAGDAWTIQTLGTGTNGTSDGIGNYNENAYWLFPTNQNGADVGTYVSNADTTNPIFTNGSYVYQLGNDGSVDVLMSFTTIDPNGNGASPLFFHIPAENIESNISTPPGFFRMTTSAGGAQNVMAAYRAASGGANYYQLINLASATLTAGTLVTASDVTGATYENVSFDITYQAFGGNT